MVLYQYHARHTTYVSVKVLDLLYAFDKPYNADKSCHGRNRTLRFTFSIYASALQYEFWTKLIDTSTLSSSQYTSTNSCIDQVWIWIASSRAEVFKKLSLFDFYILDRQVRIVRWWQSDSQFNILYPNDAMTPFIVRPSVDASPYSLQTQLCILLRSSVDHKVHQIIDASQSSEVYIHPKSRSTTNQHW